MAVIPESQVALMRKRKHLQQLIKEQRWHELADTEYRFFKDIDAAVTDPQRSPKELLAELGKVISLYKELSALCATYGNKVV